MKQTNLDIIQYISFEIHNKLYGIDIKLINSISNNINIYRVPKTPPHIRGLVNIRGDITLIYDIGIIFNNKETPINEASRIIILKSLEHLSPNNYSIYKIDTEEKPIGILAEHIHDIIPVTTDDVVPTPNNIDNTLAHYFHGVAKLKDNLLMILKTDEIYSERRTHG